MGAEKTHKKKTEPFFFRFWFSVFTFPMAVATKKASIRLLLNNA